MPDTALASTLLLLTTARAVEAVRLPVRGDELFSVAPMMGHTNRHWRFFYRMLSAKTHVYTEMIPASQLVNAALAGQHALHREYGVRDDEEGPVVLQLGGHDRGTLARAAGLGVQLGYGAINLNCGCPSAAVSGGGRASGAAMMREPTHVAECCAAMLDAVAAASAAHGRPPPLVTVKHRLGVADAAAFDPVADRAAGDGPALRSARRFIDAVSAVGVVRFQLHGRMALLGDFDPERPGPSLWVPGEEGGGAGGARQKVDHSREQIKAKQAARAATIANREAPPLRLSVVRALAAEYPELDFIANGGIDSLDAVREQLSAGCAGAMVGRAAINHPCAFASADALWEEQGAGAGGAASRALSRGEVLQRYAAYCDAEEAAALALAAQSPADSPAWLLPPIEALRRRLVACPYNLFAGVAGSERYQRQLRKLAAKRLGSESASAILRAAAARLPPEALALPVDVAVSLRELAVFERASKRAGPMQRHIH